MNHGRAGKGGGWKGRRRWRGSAGNRGRGRRPAPAEIDEIESKKRLEDFDNCYILYIDRILANRIKLVW